MTPQEALAKAIEALARPGTSKEMAEMVGRTDAAVRYWKIHGVPAGMVLPVCRACNYAVTPHELRPDIYPDPIDALPEEYRGIDAGR